MADVEQRFEPVLNGRKTVVRTMAWAAAVLSALAFDAHAIDRAYARKLERSGCTQVSEAQGCDINKTKAQNAQAGFGPPTATRPSSAPRYRDLAGANAVEAIDTMSERGFRNVDSFESGSTQYGIFYAPRSRLCVQLTMADGKVVSANDIRRHPKCR